MAAVTFLRYDLGVRRGARSAILTIPAIVGGAFHLLAHQATQQQPPTFRTTTSLVPIDVHVVDKDGKAVTDLTKADFTITEDGVPQTITQFEKDTDNDPAHPRWIVIVLGEGRIEAPFRSINALEDMIRTDLGPADRIGVIAYNRWSEFTADRTETLRLLARYKARNGQIQTDLETYDSGLRHRTHNGLGVEIVQDQIDAIFRDGPGQPIREFAPPSEVHVVASLRGQDPRFSTTRFSDVLHLYGAIDYLRTLDGERHIIYLVEQDAGYGRVRPSHLATTAADNRVALHIVQTGGFGEKQSILYGLSFRGMATIPTSTAAYFNTSRSAREVTEDTGGLSFFYTDLSKAFARIAQAISVDYLLGYIPSNENWHGEYRRVEVRVSRPGVTVMYRRGYDAVATPPPWNDRETMTDVRMAEARNAARPPRGITLQLKPTRGTDGAVHVELQVEPSGVAFTTVEGRHVASLDVAIWIADRQGNMVGAITDRIDLKLTDATYATLVKQNIVFTRNIAVTGTPFEARAAVYDYDNDRVGSASRRIQ